MFIPKNHLEEDISILSTSYSPSYPESRSLRLRMTQRDAEISSIEKDVRSGLTPQVWARRETLMKSNIVAEALLASVRKLPAELMGEIFAYTIPPLSVERALSSRPHPCDEGEPSPPHMRFVLRRVCRLWDIVARNTPCLWSTLAIVDHLNFLDFENAITYSGVCPLDVYIGKSGWCASIVKRLRPEIGRIRQLILPSPHNAFASLLIDDKFADAPRLEVFAWSWIDKLDDLSPLETGRFGFKAPSLKFMALVDSPYTLRLFHAASLKGLRRLHFLPQQTDAACSATYLELLLRCPSLEELVVHNISAVWENPLYDGAKVPLLFLKVLTIVHSHDDDTIPFLQDLHAPNLEELSLSLNTFPQFKDEGRWPIDPGLRALLAAARTSLLKLELNHLCLLGADDEPLLLSLVNLQELEIKQCIIGNAILNELTPESDSSATLPCPKLSNLVFDDAVLSGDELLRLVCYRTSLYDTPQASPSPITIKNFHGLEDYHYKELLELAFMRNITLQIHPLLETSESPITSDSDAGSVW